MSVRELTRPEATTAQLVRADHAAARRPKSADAMLSIATFALVAAALISMGGALQSGSWMFACVGCAALTVALGYLLRLGHVPILLIPFLQAIGMTLILTAMYFPTLAIGGVIPTPDAARAADQTISDGLELIRTGLSPLAVDSSLQFTLVVATIILALVCDLLICSLHTPLVAGLLVLTVYLVVPLIVPGQVNVVALGTIFVASFAAIRRTTSLRERELDPNRSIAGPTAVATIITAAGLVGGFVIAPVVEGPRDQIVEGFGPPMKISTTINLGNDLRRPRDTELLTYSTNRPSIPYLRLAALEQFDGGSWQPDTAADSTAFTDTIELPPDEVLPDVKVTQYKTRVEIGNMDSAWLPVPFPAVKVENAAGDWSVKGSSRTFLTRDGSANKVYEVITQEVRPTAEQIRAADANGELHPQLTDLPVGAGDVVSELAQEVTASATNDYDRLIALQSWFRSTAFEYSLDAPVEEGFDGDGLRAVDRFLEVRKGYCVHFASAFTLMARSLGMPSRVVMGFLPGRMGNEEFNGLPVYKVSSGQLHTWSEVYFEGLGWIAFDPTASLGLATQFAQEQAADAGGEEVGATAEPTVEPTTAPTTEAAAQPTTTAAPSTSAPTFNAWPMIGLIALILAVLGAPALVRAALRSSRLSAAKRGSAAHAWHELLATGIDYGYDPLVDASPRDVGVELQTRGAPPEAVQTLVSAIEYASYAPAGSAHADGPALVAALDEVGAALRSSAPGGTRTRALLAPRSIVMLPVQRLLGRASKESVAGSESGS